MQNEIKMFSNQKGFNDVSIITIILFIFVGTALILPFVNSEFNTSFDNENVADELMAEEFQDASAVGAGDILKSIGKIFFWTFGDLPFWLDAIFVILRIILLITLIKNFTPFLGGG